MCWLSCTHDCYTGYFTGIYHHSCHASTKACFFCLQTYQKCVKLSSMTRKQSGRLLAKLANLRNLNTESTRHDLKLSSKSSNDPLVFQSLGCYSRWRTSCKAVALCPVTSRHMMICSSSMTWNVDRMGLLSSTLNTHTGRSELVQRHRHQGGK